MLRFMLDDLTVDGLRKLADHYGVPKSVTARDQLLAALQARMASGTEVILGQAVAPWYRTPSILVSFLAALIAFGGASAGWYSVHSTVSKDVEQKQKEKVHRWQQVVIYKIIEDGTKSGSRTMSFEEIRQRYLNEASGSDVVELKKEELQPWPLRSILFDLMALQIVFQTMDDRYSIQRSSTNPRADRFFLEDEAKYTILHVLTREGANIATWSFLRSLLTSSR